MTSNNTSLQIRSCTKCSLVHIYVSNITFSCYTQRTHNMLYYRGTSWLSFDYRSDYKTDHPPGATSRSGLSLSLSCTPLCVVLSQYLTPENLADSDPVIIPYKEVNKRLNALYGIITGSLYAYFSRAFYRIGFPPFPIPMLLKYDM